MDGKPLAFLGVADVRLMALVQIMDRLANISRRPVRLAKRVNARPLRRQPNLFHTHHLHSKSRTVTPSGSLARA